jgi:hypothetical protein
VSINHAREEEVSRAHRLRLSSAQVGSGNIKETREEREDTQHDTKRQSAPTDPRPRQSSTMVRYMEQNPVATSPVCRPLGKGPWYSSTWTQRKGRF